MIIPVTLNEIREIVQRVISEVHGAIDDKLLGLCNLILKRLKQGEENFSIDKQTLSRYYPYKNCPNSLNVSLEDIPQNNSAYMAYSRATNTLKISPVVFCFANSRIIAWLMHELTHFVNSTEETNKTNADNFQFDVTTDNRQDARDIIYLFDPTEMQARASQFKQEVTNKPGFPLKSFNDTTKLNEMYQLINKVKKDAFLGQDAPDFSIIDLLLAQRAYQRSFIDKDGRERYLNISTSQEHEKAKAAIVKKLQKRYNKFFTVISKIYYDSISSLEPFKK